MASGVNREYFRITNLVSRDDGKYYIGFVKRCTCRNPPAPCICQPRSASQDKVESGDIFFHKRSYDTHNNICIPDECSTFGKMSKLITHFPIIYGYVAKEHRGKNRGKPILVWMLPPVQIECKKLPHIISRGPSLRSSKSTLSKKVKKRNHDKISATSSASTSSSESTFSILRTTHTYMKPDAKVFVPRNCDGKKRAFSPASGMMVSSIWASDQTVQKLFGLSSPPPLLSSSRRCEEISKLPIDSLLHTWIKSDLKWDNNVTCLPGITPTYLEFAKIKI